MARRLQGGSITSGNLFSAIIRFAIPLFISTLVQSLFTAADTFIIGRFTAGDGNAVAAIGAANPVISLLINSFVAFAAGASIIIAKAIGANDKMAVKKSVDTSLIFAAVLGVALTAAAMPLAVPVLNSMNCPEACFDGAVLYMQIYMLGTPAMMIYNFAAAIIRAEGDSRRPLLYVILSGIVNVATNILLCIVLTDKVAAVAIATVLSQCVAAVLTMARLMKKKEGLCRFSCKKLSFDGRMLGQILRYGIPLAAATAIYPIANLQIQPAINSYGAANLAGSTAAINVESVISALQTAFGSAGVTFMSQNIGAHNRKRVEQSFAVCGGCAVLSGLVLGMGAAFLLPEELLGLFLPGNAEAIFYGKNRLFYVAGFYWLAAMNNSLGAAVQAFGYPTMSTLNNLVSVLGFRTIWMNFVYNKAPTIDRLNMCYTISWGITCIIYIGLFVYALHKYRKQEAAWLQNNQKELLSEMQSGS